MNKKVNIILVKEYCFSMKNMSNDEIIASASKMATQEKFHKFIVVIDGKEEYNYSTSLKYNG